MDYIKRLGYRNQEERERLARMFETEFCVTRKLYCPTSYEIADVYKLLTQKSLTKIQISRITGIKEEKVSEILEVLKKGYIEKEGEFYKAV